jgi:hypothetical protein
LLRTPPRILGALMAAGTLVSSVLGLASSAGAATREPASALSCSLISSASLSSLLSMKLGSASSTVAGPTTTCKYTSSKGIVILQYETGYTEAQFKANAASDRAHGETTTELKGYGNDAVEITIGKLVAGLAVIKGSHGLLVSAIVPLAKLEAVAHQVLPKL